MRLLGRFLSQEAWFLASSTVNFGRFFFLKKSYDEVWWFFFVCMVQEHCMCSFDMPPFWKERERRKKGNYWDC